MVRTHTVAAGETLSALALRFYGDADLGRLSATASGIADPGVVHVGQRLAFPDFTRYTVSHPPATINTQTGSARNPPPPTTAACKIEARASCN